MKLGAALALAAMALLVGVATVAQGAKPYKVALITDIPPRATTHDFRGLEYLGFLRAVNGLRRPGPCRPDQPEERRRRRARPARPPEVRPGLHGPSLDRRRGSRRDALSRNALPLPGPVRLAQEQACQRPGRGLPHRAGRLSGGLPGGAHGETAARQGRDRLGRRAQPPAHRRLDRRLRAGRADAPIPAPPCSAATRRTSRIPRSAGRSPDAEIARGASVLFQVAGLCGPRHPRRGEGERALGHRRRR